MYKHRRHLGGHNDTDEFGVVMMRLLFLTPFVPSSERPDALNHIRLLSKNHEITLVALYTEDAELGDLQHVRNWAKEVHPLKLSKVTSYKGCVLRLFTRFPLYLAYYYSPALAREICMIARNHTFDLVHAHTLRMALYAQNLNSIPTVCNIQDVLTTRYREYARQGSPSLSWLLDVEEWQKLKRFEPWVCTQIKIVGVVSEVEAKLLNKLAPDVLTHVVRPGIDPYHFSPFPDAEREQSIVFLGRLSYRPNVDAALKIANDIFPRVRQRTPSTRLIIVGSDPPKIIRSLSAQPGITVTGRVPDIRPYLGHGMVSLCPMKTGGGVKHKILQSLALETPVVTNKLGATGIGLTHGKNFLLSEDDDSMVEACISLLSDPAQRKRIGEAGRDHVIRRHSWNGVAESLETFHGIAMTYYQTGISRGTKPK